jgi:putative acetyltransferase
MPTARFPMASRADVPGVIALIGRVFAEYGFLYDPATEVPDLLDFERHYQAPHGGFFVLRQDDVVTGSVGVERTGAGTAELHRLYLDAALRGQGTGRALVEAVLDWCRAEGVAHVILWSDTRFDQAHRLYERMGFRQTGHRILPGDVNESQEYRFERSISLASP